MSATDPASAAPKPEKWRTRYLIAIAMMLFFAVEFDRILTRCLSAEGCHESLATQALIGATEQGLFWAFAVVILGRAAQPIINQIAFFKFGRGKQDGETKP